MAETRKLAAILAADVVGYALAGTDEDRTLARLRALRSDLIDPTIAVHHGRVVKRTGDGALVEFRSVVDAVRCAIEVQNGMVERNAGLPLERRIEFRIGIHLGDVVEESDGDLMGDGVNIAARIEAIADPGGISLSHAAYEQVRDKVAQNFVDRGEQSLKNIARPIRVYALARAAAAPEAGKPGPPHLSIVVLPFTNIGGDPEQDYFVDGVTESLTTDLSRIAGSFVIARNTAFTYKGKPCDVKQIGRELNVRYVLEGSVQRGGDRIRFLAKLSCLPRRRHKDKLATRGDVNKFSGTYRDMLDGFNKTLDAVINPVNEAAKVLEQVAARDLSARVVGDYKGDLAKIKNSLNAAVDNLDTALKQVGTGPSKYRPPASRFRPAASRSPKARMSERRALKKYQAASKKCLQ